MSRRNPCRPLRRACTLALVAIGALATACASSGDGATAATPPARDVAPPRDVARPRDVAPTSDVAPTRDVAPMERACAELERLRAAETRTVPPPRPAAPDVERVRELYRRAEAFGLSGGFLIARGGEIVAMEACGLADPDAAVPMRTDAVFDIGSVSKQFTAAGILALQDDGLLSVHDPIARFLADVPADKRGITIHHLLTHSAGFPHDVGDPETLPGRDEAVRQMLAAPLLFAPGEGQAYSNTGYTLLAAIVDVASGRGFEGYLRERLWLPLGMTRTGMVLADRSGQQVAAGISFQGTQGAHHPDAWGADGPSWLLRGCGYISSTMEELLTWCEALRTGAVLSHEARAELLWPHVREPTDFVSYYGYGWQLTAAPDGTCLVTHNGSAGIHYLVVGMLPAHDMSFISFCTQQASAWRDFPERVLGVLAGSDELRFPPVANAGIPDAGLSDAGVTAAVTAAAADGDVAAMAGEDVAALAGDYALASGASLRLSVVDGRLVVSNSAEALRLFCPWPAVGAEDVAALGERGELVASVLDALARGDDGPLLARLPPEVPVEEERAFWKVHWPRWLSELGEYRGADVIETIRLDDKLRTLALIRFSRASTVVGFVHSADGRCYVDTMHRRFLPEVTLAPQGGGTFLSYHPGTGRTTQAVFSGPTPSSGPAARVLTVVNGAERVQLTRRPEGTPP
jgi:CubicO group peptidase (beta-lactamase class C family)